jgi:hypothetical protein
MRSNPELELPSAFSPIRNAIRRGLDGIAIQLAIRRGIRDENRLTDILFRERHTELGSRRLRANERSLIREWLAIRSGIVRPALAAARGVPTPPAALAGPAPPSPAVVAGPGVIDAIRALSRGDVAPTETNALRIVKAVAAYWAIPWGVPYTILEHEGGVRRFAHHDGVMQTIRAARETILPRLPRDLKLAALGLTASDGTSDAQLTRTLGVEFHRCLAVQIVAGTQELVTGLQNFNGYVALAFVAYNAGTGSASAIVRHAAGSRGATGSSEKWERACHAAATVLHQHPRDAVVSTGQWQCDANLAKPGVRGSGWHKRFAVHDRTSGIQLIAFQYLRSVRTQIRKNRPDLVCSASNHKQRLDGTGELVFEPSRLGALDKLFDPRKLGRTYQRAAAGELKPIPDDGSPLKIVEGRLTKVPPLSAL